MPNKTLDLAPVGGVLVSDTLVCSNFTNYNYLKTQGVFSPGSDPWDIIVGFTTGDTVSGNEKGVVTGVGSQDAVHPFWVTSAGIKSWGSSNGSSWNLWSGTVVKSGLQVNTYYKLKCSFTGSSYTWSTWNSSTNSWDVDYTITSSTPIFQGVYLCLGNNRGQSYPFNGTINADEFEVYVNGELIAQGGSQKTKIISGDECYWNVTSVGTPTLSSDGIASDFSYISYYTTPTFNLDTSESWFIEGEVERTGTTTDYQMFFGNPGYYRSINFGISPNPNYYHGLWFYPTTLEYSSVSTIPLPINTKTLVRGGYDKDNSCYYISTINNGVETRLSTYNSTAYRDTAIHNPLAIGMHFYQDNTSSLSYAQPFKVGNIDMTTVRFVRGSYEWKAVEKIAKDFCAIGSDKIENAYLGLDRIDRMYLGETLVYEKSGVISRGGVRVNDDNLGLTILGHTIVPTTTRTYDPETGTETEETGTSELTNNITIDDIMTSGQASEGYYSSGLVESDSSAKPSSLSPYMNGLTSLTAHLNGYTNTAIYSRIAPILMNTRIVEGELTIPANPSYDSFNLILRQVSPATLKNIGLAKESLGSQYSTISAEIKSIEVVAYYDNDTSNIYKLAELNFTSSSSSAWTLTTPKIPVIKDGNSHVLHYGTKWTPLASSQYSTWYFSSDSAQIWSTSTASYYYPRLTKYTNVVDTTTYLYAEKTINNYGEETYEDITLNTSTALSAGALASFKVNSSGQIYDFTDLTQ